VIASVRCHAGGVAAILWLVLLLPPLQRALESSMAMQMLVQIPLLIGAGYLLRDSVPARMAALIERWNQHGISGLVLTTLVGAVWMLPRSLDAAVNEPWVAVAKFITVPLLIGLPLGLSWPHMGFVMRGVFLLELIATFFRLGWLYMVSPLRLCNSYLLDDQQQTGEYMLVIGAVILAGVLGKLLWGHFDSAPPQ
jgi:hypothetical protein